MKKRIPKLGGFIRHKKVKPVVINLDQISRNYKAQETVSAQSLYKKGLINYVKERRTEEVELTKEDEIEIESALRGIKEILNRERPPQIIDAKYCKKCAYYYFCYVKEEE